MTEVDEAWLEAVATLTGRCAVLLDAGGGLQAAEPSAIKLAGASGYDDLTRIWRSAAGSVKALCMDARAGGEARGELELASGSQTIPLSLRVLELAAPSQRWLVLLAKRNAEPEDDARLAFARKVGHDLRGPLNAMVLNLDLLRTSLAREEVEAEISSKRQRYLGSLQREIDRMNETLTAAVAEVRSASRSQ